MENLLYISVAVIAFMFFILVIYLVKTLNQVRRATEKVCAVVEKVDKQIEPMLISSTELIQNSNELVKDVKVKVDQTTAVFDAVGSLKDEVVEITETVSTFSKMLTKFVNEKGNLVASLANNTQFVLDLFKRWTKKREDKNSIVVKDTPREYYTETE